MKYLNRLSVRYLFLVFSLVLLVTSAAHSASDPEWMYTQPEGGNILLLHVPVWDSTLVFASVETRGVWEFDIETEHWSMINEGLPKSYIEELYRESEYLVVHPQAFASSPSIPGELWCYYAWGSIYKYDTSESTWILYSDGIPVVADNVYLHIDSEDPDIVFLTGAIEPSIRTSSDVVHISRDRGLTWTDIDTLVCGPVLEMHKKVPGRLLIGDYLSDDDGETWKRHFLYENGEYTYTIVQLAEDPTDGTLWAIAQAENAFLPSSLMTHTFYSDDACSTWVEVQQSSGYAWLTKDAFAVTYNGNVWGHWSNDGVRVSYDHGETFVEPSVFNDKRLVNALYPPSSIIPISEDTLYIATANGLWMSGSEDTVFVPKNSGLQALFLSDLVYRDYTLQGMDPEGDTVYINSAGNIYRTVDAGITWEFVTNKREANVELVKYNHGIAYLWKRHDTAQETTFLISSFDPENPTSSEHDYNQGPNLSDYIIRNLDVAVDPFIENRIYLMACDAGFNNKTWVWISEDNGENWNLVHEVPADDETAYVEICVDPEIPGLVYMMGDSLAYSRDYGLTWTSFNVVSSNEIGDAVFFPEDPDLIAVLEIHTNVYISYDGGKSFTQISILGMKDDEWKTGMSLARLPGTNPRRILFDGGNLESWLTHTVNPDSGQWIREQYSTEFLTYGVPFVTDNYWFAGGEIGIIRRLSSNQVGIEDRIETPRQYTPGVVYPNPFNSTTSYKFNLENNQFVTIGVYNVLGEHVETLCNTDLSAGNHRVFWEAGSNPSGIYFLRSVQNGEINTKRIVLIR